MFFHSQLYILAPQTVKGAWQVTGINKETEIFGKFKCKLFKGIRRRVKG